MPAVPSIQVVAQAVAASPAASSSAASEQAQSVSAVLAIEGSVHAVDDAGVLAARFGEDGAAMLQQAAVYLQAGELQEVKQLLTPVATGMPRQTLAINRDGSPYRDPSTGPGTSWARLKAEVLAGLAQCQRREGAFSDDVLEDQLGLFEEAIALHAAVAAYHAAAADILHKLGRLREAAERLQEALSLEQRAGGLVNESSVILFAEDVADPRRWQLQLDLVRTQLASATETAELHAAELLAGLEAEAGAEAAEAARRQERRVQRAAKKKEKKKAAQEALSLEEPEPELMPEPEPEPEQWPPPELSHQDGVLRPLSGTDATAPDGTPVTMVLAVPSAPQPLLTVTATEAVDEDDDESPQPAAAAEIHSGVPQGTARDGSIPAGMAAQVSALEELEEVEGEEVDEGAGVGFGLKDSSSHVLVSREAEELELERMLAEKAEAVVAMEEGDAAAAFAAAADDAQDEVERTGGARPGTGTGTGTDGGRDGLGNGRRQELLGDESVPLAFRLRLSLSLAIRGSILGGCWTDLVDFL